MTHLGQHTMAHHQHFSGLEGLGNLGGEDTQQRHFPNPDHAVLAVQPPGNDASTTGTSDIDGEQTGQMTSYISGETHDRFDWILPSPELELWEAPTFHALQEWEGYVLVVEKTVLVARLIDLTANSPHEEEEAEIPLAEISESDLINIRPGSIFRWVIGYERSVAGSKRRVSEIVFRDVHEINDADRRDGEAWALEAIRLLNLSDAGESAG